MAIETSLGAVGPRLNGAHAPLAAGLVGRDAGAWVLARVADEGGEAAFLVESDERFFRLRRVVGEVSSMYEEVLSLPVAAHDLGLALVRWAHAAGVSARLGGEPEGPVRVVVTARRGD